MSYLIKSLPDRVMNIVAPSRVMLVKPLATLRVYNEITREMLVKPTPIIRVFRKGD